MRNAHFLPLFVLIACQPYWVVESEPHVETLSIGPDFFTRTYAVEVLVSDSAIPDGNFDDGPGRVGASLEWVTAPTDPLEIELYVGEDNAAYPQLFTETSSYSYTSDDFDLEDRFTMVNIRTDGGGEADVILTIHAEVKPLIDSDGNEVGARAPADATLELVVDELGE